MVSKNRKEDGKMKKALVVALIMGLTVLSVCGAQGAVSPPWYNCTVAGAGADAAGNMTVTLTNPSFTGQSITNPANTVVFIIDNSQGKANLMYAGALTAFSIGSTVLVNLTGTTDLSLCTYLAPLNTPQ
jgi:hypothetical protein